MSKVIGLTGGIGSGKSTVSKILQRQGIRVIDTDQISRKVVEPGTEGLAEIVKTFGNHILDENDALDRAKLREIIFQDRDKKELLEAVIHPVIQQETRNAINASKPTHPLIVVAIPLLVEAILKNKRPDYIDEVWLVDCSVEDQINRATERDKNSKEQIQNIINMQATREQRLQHADKVIENTGSLERLEKKVLKALKSELKTGLKST